MAATDSVSIFGEGTFEEQVQELVTYVARSRSEEDKALFIRPFQEVLKTAEGQKPLAEDIERRRKLFTMVLDVVTSLGDGSEKEIEGFFNLIYSHLFSLFPSDSPDINQHLKALLQIISTAPSEGTAIKYRILSNLFNVISRTASLRLPVYNILLQIASKNGEIDTLQISTEDVDKWLNEWDISQQEKSQLLKDIMEALEKSNRLEKSYQFRLRYVQSLPSSSAQDAAVELISTTLRLPSIFDFDQLFKIDAVVGAKDHEIFALFNIFRTAGLSEFNTWVDSHPDVFEKYKLDKVQLGRKIRLLTLATLGFENIGRELSYFKIATALQIDSSEVEKWVIDVIRAGLISGKLSQTAQTLHVTRSTSRTFEREQWEALEKRLVAWKTGLVAVLEVVASARQTSGTEPSIERAPEPNGVTPQVVAA